MTGRIEMIEDKIVTEYDIFQVWQLRSTTDGLPRAFSPASS